MKNISKSKDQKKEDDQEFSPKVARLKGVIKLPEDFDYKKELAKAITNSQHTRPE